MDWLHRATWPLFAEHGRLNPWPDESERLLLTVILSEPEAAILAWHEWRRSNVLDRVSGGSFQLLPQVHQRLRQLAGDDPDMGRLCGISRHVWVSNQRALSALRKCLAMFAEAGIPLLVLKGLPVLRYYGDLGARPASDVDLLVPDEYVQQACHVLQGKGWTLARPTPSLELERMFGHAVALKHQDTALAEVDLHWRAFMLDSDPRAERALWARAVDVTVADQRYRVPNPLDQLLLTFYNGRKPDFNMAGRWITDAVMIARALEEKDWETLPARAQEAGLLAPVNECIEYLSSSGWLPLPQVLRSDLAARLKSEPIQTPWGLQASCRRKNEAGLGFFENMNFADKCFWLVQWCRAVRRVHRLRWRSLFLALCKYLRPQTLPLRDIARSAEASIN